MSPRALTPPAKRRKNLAGLARIETMNRQADKRRESDVPGALGLAREAERLARIGGHRAAAGFALLSQSNCHTDQGQYPEALVCARKALDDLIAGGDAAGQARALNLIGNVFTATARYAQAMAFYRRSLRVLEGAGLDTTRAHRSIGIVLFHTGSHAQARRSHETALSRALAAGDKRYAGLILMDLGNCISAAGDERAALNYYLESLAIHEREAHLVEQAYALRNLGDSYRRLGRIAKVRDALRRATKLAKTTGELRLRVYLFTSLAELETEAGDDAAAAAHYEAALRIARRTGNRSAEAQVRADLGAAARARNRHRDAAAHFNAALTIACEIGDRSLVRKLRAALAER